MIKSSKQSFLVLAQDPGVRGLKGERIFVSIDVPMERLSLGPTGYRVKVVDFDAEVGVLYKAHEYKMDEALEKLIDPFASLLPEAGSVKREKIENELLANPMFHCQNTYALVMRTLAKFEYALGRRVNWGFDGHQLHIAPHAFTDANAFYSRYDRSLMFGYFKSEIPQNSPASKSPDDYVFTCLSHDIVVHETTHAIIDGLRKGFMNLSGPDQAAFHEGFSDVIALLSIFSIKEIVEFALVKIKSKGNGAAVKRKNNRLLIHKKLLTTKVLMDTALLGLAEEFGKAIGMLRINALRRSVKIKPFPDIISDPEYAEPHMRGEILVAAITRSLLKLWQDRIMELGTFDENYYSLTEVAAEGAKVADHLLTMSIRALDYCPPLDLEFGDFLAALLTIDSEIAPDDNRYKYRDTVLSIFNSFGIYPPAARTDAHGCWKAFSDQSTIQYRRTNFESMLRDSEEVFRFIWENRGVLEINEKAYTEVTSVRPSIRIGPEGFILRETICEYISRANIFGAELKSVCSIIQNPDKIQSNTRLTVYGAGTLVFDQYGQVKYHISRPMNDEHWQRKRLEYLASLDLEVSETDNIFAGLHQARAYSASRDNRIKSATRNKSTR